MMHYPVSYRFTYDALSG